MEYQASYLKISNDLFIEKIDKAYRSIEKCCLCGNFCKANRKDNQIGFCNSGEKAEIASWGKHFGEEPPFALKSGAGAIFFAHCNLKCVYCQNYQISQKKKIDNQIDAEQLCLIMLELQKQGAQNIDLVSPTHFLPQILKAIYLAKKKGLVLPILYNTNAYESDQAIELLDGIIDIYMPDFKYFDDEIALKYSKVKNYVSAAKNAVKRMYSQVGDFLVDEDGAAVRGLLIRHLVLPGNLSGSFKVLDFLSNELGNRIGLSIMSQYAACYKANKIDELNKQVDPKLYNDIVNQVEEYGFKNCWIQDFKSNEIYFPDFKTENVFKDN